jgi:hypothetical protein
VSPVADQALQGYARCTNQGCEQFDADRPIDLVRTVKEIRGESPLQNLVISESVYYHPVDDDDMICPGCSMPCAVLPEKRRVVPHIQPMG